MMAFPAWRKVDNDHRQPPPDLKQHQAYHLHCWNNQNWQQWMAIAPVIYELAVPMVIVREENQNLLGDGTLLPGINP